MYKILCIVALLGVYAPSAYADQGFKGVFVTKQGTTQATVTATALFELTGSISVYKPGQLAPIKVCSPISFHTGVPASCVVGGLTTGITYAAIAQGTTSNGQTTYKNDPPLQFTMGTVTPPVTPTTNTNTQNSQTQNGGIQQTASTATTLGNGSTTLTTTTTSTATDQCHDGKDNNGDGKADQYGVDIPDPATGKTDGIIDLEPDPSCFSPTATQEANDDVVSTIIPCTDKCTFSDVFRLLNNIISFFFTTLLIPIFIIILMYSGYQYIAAQGDPSKIANLKKILRNIALGIIIVLCAWLVVRTIMLAVLNEDFKKSSIEFLGN